MPDSHPSKPSDRQAEPLQAVADAPTLAPSSGGAAPTANTVRRFGDYELLDEIARGGMGVVYKARQLRLNRTVAIKMILAGQLASPEEVRRFFTEAEAAAAMQHPNIVAIHEVGCRGGAALLFRWTTWSGQNLAALVRNSPLSAEPGAARYVKTMAVAIQYAHDQGKLHRDLKPSNIIIDEMDQVRRDRFLALTRSIEGELGADRDRPGAGDPELHAPGTGAGQAGRGLVGPASERSIPGGHSV